MTSQRTPTRWQICGNIDGSFFDGKGIRRVILKATVSIQVSSREIKTRYARLTVLKKDKANRKQVVSVGAIVKGLAKEREVQIRTDIRARYKVHKPNIVATIRIAIIKDGN